MNTSTKEKFYCLKLFSNANCTADTKLCLSGSIFDAIGLFARIAKLVTITYIFYIFMQKFDSIWLVCLLDENFWFRPNQYSIHIYIVTNSKFMLVSSFLIFFYLVREIWTTIWIEVVMKIFRLTVSVMILSNSMRGAMWKSNTKYCETERMIYISQPSE